jgi:nucleoside-specific outer membrane channel protein Tsx
MTLHRLIVRAVAGAALVAAFAAAPARAEFGTTNLQLLQGYSFDDNLLGYNTNSGTMTTLTVNHFSTWKYGDVFAFVDMQRGVFRDGFDGQSSQRALIYAEVHPRLFLNKLLGLPAGGFIKNWGLAGEVNQTAGFYAYLGGLGLDLNIPGFQVAGLNLFYRYDWVQANTFNNTAYTSTWQISPYWDIPFKIGPTSWTFNGFVDITTNHDKKLDIMAQPELLLDVGAFAGAPGTFHVGVEWYVHSYRNFVDDKTKTVSAPQVMVQWTPFTQFVP